MKNILKASKKAQLRIGDAPGVVLIVLFLFMILGTSAYLLDKYQEAFGTDSVTMVDEVVTQAELIALTQLEGSSACNAENLVVVSILNSTGTEILTAANYSVNASTWVITNLTSEFTINDWWVNYTFDFTGIECNVTSALTEELEDNVSIAGMILTISLIGIVLSILIGLFYVFTTKKGM